MRRTLARVGLGFAALYLVVVEPLWLAIEMQGALPRLAAYGAPAWLLAAGRGGVAILGLAAGRGLWAGRPGALTLACAWAIGAMVLLVLTAATPYFPANRPPSIKPVLLAVWLTAYGAAAVGFGVAASHQTRR